MQNKETLESLSKNSNNTAYWNRQASEAEQGRKRLMQKVKKAQQTAARKFLQKN